ncbi:TIGR04283 family arsenosugar biosynthesis glycosyltransferase [Flavobacterium algicola]|uniref:TIGR04283 family arsenosugar biosynthesis glycosyltransferase n=1 Tax=Flavobacterium algicola TaxID=556529 RepID=UPI001EFC43DB|nr:TIGR04283 family arsenosugar biosynthesis glycosyltransferase [Flavobacterium algicola]MCG9792245.1 TIGR04283 family arsenosugar biosynthesis glycosyltransferase [Flavobacterium algicola]
MNKISIIIPIYNEVENIKKTLLYIESVISKSMAYEIIVVDGGSTDGSANQVQSTKTVRLISSPKGRAKQLNCGAKNATGTIFYFLHCDSLPPKNFDIAIVQQMEKGRDAGCFRMKFDLKHPILVVSQWFTRFNHISCRGGDQSLFVSKLLFEDIGGFNEAYSIYEDNEIIERLYAKKQFVVVPKYVITSARKYKQNGVWRLQFHFSMIHLKRKMGFPINDLQTYYQKNII